MSLAVIGFDVNNQLLFQYFGEKRFAFARDCTVCNRIWPSAAAANVPATCRRGEGPRRRPKQLAPFVYGSSYRSVVMKRPKRTAERRRPRLRQQNAVIDEMLKYCLRQVCTLQADLERSDDAEAAGYAACVYETMRFLHDHGLTDDHPTVRRLTEHLLPTDH